ncbi:MAG: hypothetical protein IJ010_05535, partial [Ruminococcus sp.]|nr:hypothetical protein [Ruminococcus sp.]
HNKKHIFNVKYFFENSRIFSHFQLLLYINRSPTLPSLCKALHKDGWGESLEQKYMRTEGGEINISFWSDDEAWALVPEDEYLNDNIQDMEMSM